VEIGSGVTIDKHGWIAAYESYQGHRYEPLILIGDGVTIGRYLCLTAINRVEIGANCLFSEYVYISDHFHGTDPLQGPPVLQGLESKGPVLIGESTFLGYRACVLPGVSLGKHCVVGANAVVTRSFPDFSMIAGAPARLIKRYVVGKRKWEVVSIGDGLDGGLARSSESPVTQTLEAERVSLSDRNADQARKRSVAGTIGEGAAEGELRQGGSDMQHLDEPKQAAR